MSPIRSFVFSLAVLLLASFVTACGSGDSESSRSDDARDAGTDTTEVEPGSEEAVEAKTGVASIAITPELTACMTKAGYTQDLPAATGSVASWTHPDGARVVIAPSSDVALTVAGEIGTADAPANVDGQRVSTGSPALTGAAAACLDA